MIVAGVDPGMACCGYTVIYCDEAGRFLRLGAWGTVVTKPTDGDTMRRARLVVEALKPYLAQADRCGIETQHARWGETKQEIRGKAARTMNVALVAGAVGQAARDLGLDVVEVTPQHAKLALAGRGNADKGAMKSMARSMTRVEMDDAQADALGMALACARVVIVPDGAATGTQDVAEATKTARGARARGKVGALDVTEGKRGSRGDSGAARGIEGVRDDVVAKLPPGVLAAAARGQERGKR
jgi:Holliday junction resolvasome RuvABC endonuclease subunit